MALGGLLSGFIGGAAAGIDDVAKLSLEERAQQRKDDLAQQMARIKASGAGSGKEPTPDWELKSVTKKVIGADGEETTVTKSAWVNRKNQQVIEAHDESVVNKYVDDISFLVGQHNMSPAEAKSALEKEYRKVTGNPDYTLPSDIVELVMLTRNLKRGGTRPPVIPETENPPEVEKPKQSFLDGVFNKGGGDPSEDDPVTSTRAPRSRSRNVGRSDDHEVTLNEIGARAIKGGRNAQNWWEERVTKNR